MVRVRKLILSFRGLSLSTYRYAPRGRGGGSSLLYISIVYHMQKGGGGEGGGGGGGVQKACKFSYVLNGRPLAIFFFFFCKCRQYINISMK